jgi:hypothetical protein
MTLEGFGKTSKTAKRASAVPRIFKPSDWGVVDWRVAAMLKQLELNDWNVDEALSRPVYDEKPWITYIEINDWLTLDLNAIYRAKRNKSLQLTADVEMAIFSLSFKVPRWNRVSCTQTGNVRTLSTVTPKADHRGILRYC